MRFVVAVTVATALLCGCGETPAPATDAAPITPVDATPPPPTPVQGPAESFTSENFTVPPPIAADQELIAGLEAGGSAILRLDACPRNLAKEQLAAVACGVDYQVFYEPMTLRWGAIGPNSILLAQKAENPVLAAKNPGAPPSTRMVIVWGVGFNINDKYQATLGDGTVIGRLIHASDANTPAAQAPKPAPAAAPTPAPAQN